VSPQPFDCFFLAAGAGFLAGAAFGTLVLVADDFRLLGLAVGAGVEVGVAAVGVASAGTAPAEALVAPASALLCGGVGESAGADEREVGRCVGAPIGRPR
jgi:hypothetical protein